MRLFDVYHVAHGATPYIGAAAAWMLGRSSRSRWSRLSWSVGSGTSRTASQMSRRLGRTPLLRRDGRLPRKRYTR